MAKVTICIPTYNRVQALPEVLDAIRNQTFKDYELIIGDDGSTDGTFEYLSSLNWENLRVVRHEKNVNLYGNLSVLFAMARGRYIAIHHDGDVCFPYALANLVDLLERNPAAGFAHSACIAVEAGRSERVYPLEPEKQLFLGSAVLPGEKLIEILCTRIHTPIASSLSLWRRNVVERAGGYRPDWKLASDEDLYRRVATIAGSCFHPEPLFRMPARLLERRAALGSWSGLYTLYEFRRDTTLRFWQKAPWMQRRWNVCRLSGLKANALIRESVSVWLRGDGEELDLALAWDRVPPLPTGRPPLPLLGKGALRLWIGILRALSPVGVALGRWRRRLKRTAP